MKIVGKVRSTETRDVEVEADTYAEAKAKLEAQIPDGWQLQSIREANVSDPA